MTSLVLAIALIAQQPQVATPAQQKALISAIKAERESKSVTAPAKPTAVSPSDVSPRAKLRARRAAQRSYNAKQDALDAARLAQQKREALMLLPFQLKAQQDMLRYQADVYAADQRLQGDRAIANGLKGVSAPPY